MTGDAARGGFATFASEFGVIGGFRRDLSEQTESRRRIELVDESGRGSRVYYGW